MGFFINISAFIFFLLALQIVCLIVGKASSKELKNEQDYFLAGKGLRFFPLLMTFIATQVGGGLVLGSAEEAYQFGWSVLFFPLGSTLGLIALGLFVGKKLAGMNISTIAQIFESVYGSPMLKKLASILSMLSLFMIFSAQIIASRKFMISLGIENYFLFFCFWGMVIFYTASGGLKAVVATDVVQAIFFIIIFIFSFVWVFFTLDPIIMSEQAVSIDNPILNSSKIYSWLLMPLFFMIIEQDMGQRCFAAKSPRVVTKATLWAALSVFLVSIIPVYFGVLAKDLGLEISAGSSVLMTVINERTTPLITALVGCAILTAIISTADSLINAISSNLAQDFKLSLSIRSSQFVTVGISILGIVFSFAFTNVVDLLLQSYELSVSCLFVPIFFSLFKKERAILSAALSIGLGAFGFIFFRIVTLPIPGEISAVILSFGGFYLGEFISVVRRVQLSKIHEASMESR